MEQATGSTAEKKGGIGCFKIFLWTVLILVLISVAGIYYVYQNIGDWSRAGSAAMVEAMTTKMTAELDIAPGERAEVEAVMNDFARAIRDEEITLVQGMAVIGYITKGPVLAREVAEAFKKGYLQTSDLPPEEKRFGALQFDRLTRGVYELKIPFDKLEQIGDIIWEPSEDADGERVHTIRADLTDEEVRALIERAKSLADQAGVSDQVVEIDLSDAIKDAIERGKQAKNVEDLERIFDSSTVR